jgi:hypothetical protein
VEEVRIVSGPDVVARLRCRQLRTGALCREAADEIERLRAEVNRLQRIVMDSTDAASDAADCEELCLVLCAGPCEGRQP